MKLIKDNVELDSSIEHELFSGELGFTVTIVYTEESWLSEGLNEPYTETVNNITEVHHLYKSPIGGGRLKIAFESDIHNTGFTRDVNDIESVHIIDAVKLEDDF